MHTMIRRNRLSNIMVRTAVAGFLATAGTMGLYAQHAAEMTEAAPATNLKASLAAPVELPATALSTPGDLNYSSSIGETAAADAKDYLSFDGGQPPPRRHYGRPNYTDSRTNSDGSRKYSFFAGGGFGLPTGGTHNYLTTGYGFQVGASRNLNKRFGVAVQFDYDHFGFQTNTLNNQLAIYQFLGFQNGYSGYGGTGSGSSSLIQQVGGSSHVWSFSLDPKYTFYEGGNFGAYGVVGVGFYHKTANFTTPGVGQFCTYYGCFPVAANQTIDKYTSNAPGFSAGFGVTYKPSRFANERFFAEAKYVFVDNSRRAFSYGTATGGDFNVFPQNSDRTTYIPVKFGIIF